MTYALEIREKAQRDFDAIPAKEAARLSKRIVALSNDLAGDVKRLTNFTPSYRLRVGDWRVLFDVTGTTVIIHRVLHRREHIDFVLTLRRGIGIVSEKGRTGEGGRTDPDGRDAHRGSERPAPDISQVTAPCAWRTSPALVWQLRLRRTTNL